MRKYLLFASALLTLGMALPAMAQQIDAWAPVRPLLGVWQGASEGQPGEGTVVREYAFVLGGKFIKEVNTSTYPPQEKNPKGEVHEHVGMISYDKGRKSLVLRQFHIEGFVNTYRQAMESLPEGGLVFASEAFENLGAEWRAKESYEFIGEDEFIERFELAPPGKPYALYSVARFKRVRK